MKNNCRIPLIVFFLIYLIIFVSAQFSNDRMKVVLEGIGIRVNDFVLLLFCLIWYLAAGLAAFLILWSGIKYLTSDDFAGRNKAKSRLIQAIVGLIIVIIACPLINYLIEGTPVLEFSCVCVP